MDGIKHILGLWIADNEGAAFWASVCADLANRGVQDMFIVCCDGLKGLPEAVEATWPNSMVQTCIVHLIRAANTWVSYQDRKPVSSALREVYTAPNEDTARAAQRAKKAKRATECNGYIEGAKANGWKQAINQLAVAYPDRFADYL